MQVDNTFLEIEVAAPHFDDDDDGDDDDKEICGQIEFRKIEGVRWKVLIIHL